MDFEKFVVDRKFLHQHPELSGSEVETVQYIRERIVRMLPDANILILTHGGLLATVSGKEAGKHVLLRCELDALPIQETNQFKHQSLKEGVSHKCGHDGHMAIMLSVADYLATKPLQKGAVSLLFQSAEEIGRGAKFVLKDEEFRKRCEPDFVFALHNVPGFPLHQIIGKEGIFTPSVISVRVKLKGKTSHASEPEKGINPGKAISQILNEVSQLEEFDEKASSFTIITPIYIVMGSLAYAYGTSAGDGKMGFTLRTWRNEAMTSLRKNFEQIISKIATSYKLEFALEWKEEFRAVENNSSCNELIKEAAKHCELEYKTKKEPFKWGEDFGLYTENYPGAMFALGAGENTPALHNPDYDFPDELIETGRKMFIQIIEIAQEWMELR